MLRVKNGSYLISNNNNCAICSIYNENGDKLVEKNNPIPSILLNRPVFVQPSSASLLKKSNFAVKHVEEYNSALFKTQNTSEEEILKEKYSKRMIKIYYQISSRLEEILTNRNFSSETLKVSEEIIEECFNANYFELRSILLAIRKKSDYISNHSFSLLLLFLQAIENFKESIYEDGFYKIFKQRSGKINFNRDSIKRYALGALLHDYGKVFIPDEILNKKGKLTENEFNNIKKHPVYGVRALMQAGIEDRDILHIVGDHHGRYRLFNSEEQGPLAQICNILDMYDAIQSKNPYRGPLTADQTIKILHAEKKHLNWSDYIFKHIINEIIPEFQKKEHVGLLL